MDATPERDWTVPALARVSGVSEAHFARCFRVAFGVPPHRYLLARRLERAAALLRESDLPITEIALQTGWSSLGSFSRTFRDVHGESPSTHRRQVRPATAAAIPVCHARAAQRPDLKIAVSEKRREEQKTTVEASD